MPSSVSDLVVITVFTDSGGFREPRDSCVAVIGCSSQRSHESPRRHICIYESPSPNFIFRVVLSVGQNIFGAPIGQRSGSLFSDWWNEKEESGFCLNVLPAYMLEKRKDEWKKL